jgi:hypothetical protein
MNSNDNSHEPLVDQVLVGFDLAAEHHIANCAPCQDERERIEDALRQFATANREYAARPESFWEQQAARIRAASIQSRQRSRITMALVPCLVVLLLAAFAVLGRAPGVSPVETTNRAVQPPMMQVDSDHELLLGVERAMQADTPRALEPAALIVEESDNNLSIKTTLGGKETGSHEN